MDKNSSILNHVMQFGMKRFDVDLESNDSYFRSDKNSATLHGKVKDSNWRVSIRASIVDDEVFFGITTIGGGHGYNTHLFTDIVTSNLLDRYLEKSYQKVMEGISQ